MTPPTMHFAIEPLLWAEREHGVEQAFCAAEHSGRQFIIVADSDSDSMLSIREGAGADGALSTMPESSERGGVCRFTTQEGSVPQGHAGLGTFVSRWWFNARRLHSSNNYRSPIDWENLYYRRGDGIAA